MGAQSHYWTSETDPEEERRLLLMNQLLYDLYSNKGPIEVLQDGSIRPFLTGGRAVAPTYNRPSEAPPIPDSASVQNQPRTQPQMDHTGIPYIDEVIDLLNNDNENLSEEQRTDINNYINEMWRDRAASRAEMPLSRSNPSSVELPESSSEIISELSFPEELRANVPQIVSQEDAIRILSRNNPSNRSNRAPVRTPEYDNVMREVLNAALSGVAANGPTQYDIPSMQFPVQSSYFEPRPVSQYSEVPGGTRIRGLGDNPSPGGVWTTRNELSTDQLAALQLRNEQQATSGQLALGARGQDLEAMDAARKAFLTQAQVDASNREASSREAYYNAEQADLVRRAREAELATQASIEQQQAMMARETENRLAREISVREEILKGAISRARVANRHEDPGFMNQMNRVNRMLAEIKRDGNLERLRAVDDLLEQMSSNASEWIDLHRIQRSQVP